ncbi:bile acid:sodium symporter family protein [Fulvivirga sedimenti]|uniref:Bile acid:sodium symporter family protein n=1 Tax=Fulvivirga sedimenti TaxID=2879465 RepID=A0A9X1HQY5_9BACT|nr:bile acid:sodium symporter family protein [Fulvivirga sedimenti]MCA6075164.1 bile acid:sodium symporter family protein [Fulvivirga sedimenti]MCA6076341.1 bile acid:sodium symporter family protein [Fulvivirga sedimenti]MCA6077469.1 bile acid:sodium symporter family protein [Fulvivirga sedimenti]
MSENQPLPLQDVHIDFSDDNMWLMNICLAIIMFSVALSINLKDFQEIFRNPRGVISGLISQYLLFPFMTFLLVLVMRPDMGLALGMILIAACPGGNISNFFSLQSRGNVALSVSLTVMATLLAPLMTPFNFHFWARKVEYVKPLLSTISINYYDLALTVLLIMVIPLMLGMYLANRFPDIAQKLFKPLQVLSVLILLAFIAVAFVGNLDVFADYWEYFVFLVFIHNGLALLMGYVFGRLTTGSLSDAKTISIETGIQNGGLGLLIVFTFFGGKGGMVLLVAWWGIWDIISGLIIAQIYKRWQLVSMNT